MNPSYVGLVDKSDARSVPSGAGAIQAHGQRSEHRHQLLKELVDVTIAGDDEPVATMDRPWYTAALAADTAQDMLRAYVAGTSSILERVAPIGKVLEAAVASDPEVAALWPPDVDPRYVVQQDAAKALVGKPGARAEVSAEEAADLLYGLLSPALYLLFVRERGWSRKHWEQWVTRTLCDQLLRPGPLAGPPDGKVP